MVQDSTTYYVWIGGSCDYGYKEPTHETRAETKLALPLQRNFHRRMNDEQKLIRTFVVERTD